MRKQITITMLMLGAALLGGAANGFAQTNALPGAADPARVVVVQGAALSSAYLADEARVEAAFNRGLLRLTGAKTIPAAWRTLIQTNDTVGIKVFSAPGPLCGTRPAVAAAIVRGLLAAGVPAGQIILWDKRPDDLESAGYFALGKKLGVPVASAVKSGFDEKTFYLPDSPVTGSPLWSDLEFGKTGEGVGRKSFVSTLVSRRLTKIISTAPLQNENSAGVCGHLFSLALGSVDNTRRFEDRPDRLAVALPEIVALPALGDRVALCVTDALLAQYQGGPGGYLQFTTVTDQLWLSRDPVALDTLAVEHLSRERRKAGEPRLRFNPDLFNFATLVKLGESDTNRIRVETIR